MKCMIPECEEEAVQICPDLPAGDEEHQGSEPVPLHLCEDDYAKHAHFDHGMHKPGPRAKRAVFDGDGARKAWGRRSAGMMDVALRAVE